MSKKKKKSLKVTIVKEASRTLAKNMPRPKVIRNKKRDDIKLDLRTIEW